MSGGLEIEPEAMLQAADTIDAANTEVQALLDQFTAALEQYADAFGGDTVGSLVGMAHQAVVDATTECFTSNIEDITEHSQAVREMAEMHRAADDEMAQAFDGIAGSLRG